MYVCLLFALPYCFKFQVESLAITEQGNISTFKDLTISKYFQVQSQRHFNWSVNQLISSTDRCKEGCYMNTFVPLLKIIIFIMFELQNESL